MIFGGYVDLDRYPLNDEQRRSDFVNECKQVFSRNGVLTLPGFLTPHGLKTLADEANRAAQYAFRQEKSHNVYLVPDDLSVAEDHPARRRVLTQTSTVADDRIPQNSTLRAIYQSPILATFLAEVLDKHSVYPFEDPLASLNIGVTENNQQLNWHFDDAKFATTLFLQAAEHGGEFEYVPNLRGAANECEAIGEILDGERSSVITLPLTPGTLALFAGHNSLHRVAPVRGPRTRLMAILSYAEHPGVSLDPHTRKTFYGREQ